MPDSVDREVVEALAREVMGQVAPEEIEFFDELAEEFYAPPATGKAPAGDEELAFGVEGMLVAVTPAAMAVIGAVLTFLANEIVLEVVKDEGGELLKKRLRSLVGRGQPEAVPALTGAQLQRVQERARAEAIAFGVDQTTAERLAKALVGALVVSP